MNIALIILGIILVIVGVVIAVVSVYNKHEYDREITKGGKSTIALCIVLGIVLFVSGFCFKIVPTGYTGVRTTFGQISEQTVQKGFNFKIPFVQSIKLVNNKQQDVMFESQIWGETNEKVPVYADKVTVTYQVNAEKSAWIYANVSGSTKNLITRELLSSAIKSATVELNEKEVTNRSKIEPNVKEKLAVSLNEKYGENTVAVLKVVIDDMDFEPEYNAAIAAKSIAQQNYEKQQIENETAIAKAEADKKVAITNAEAKAEAELINAEAQAKANDLLEKSLTDKILREMYIEKWDGKLPSVVSDGSIITDVTGSGNIQGE